MEYGIFNDEGQVERGMFSLAEAQGRLAIYPADDGCWTAKCCNDHPENEQSNCEDCDKDGCDDC